MTEFLLYDDLDPECLTGGIDFHGIGYYRLSEHCHKNGVRVVADVHTHPGGHARQSSVDQQHPMVSRAGHIALVVPNLARGRIRPRDVGLHRYQLNRTWEEWHGIESARRFHIGWLR